MCLITLNWQPGSSQPLLLAANRDELYARPTRSLHHWPGQQILAGKDLQAGGTWLGLGCCANSGRIRLAALTNYRDVGNHKVDAASRGQITAAFLNSSVSAKTYLEALSSSTAIYNPFNLILFDSEQLMGFESRHSRLFKLPEGITSVSNADFNTPWPKLLKLQSNFEQLFAANIDEYLLNDRIFKLLHDDSLASDQALPRTGLPIERERVLSAAFIRSPDYGTRACSIVRISDQVAQFAERSFDANGFTGEVSETISRSQACQPQ